MLSLSLSNTCPRCVDESTSTYNDNYIKCSKCGQYLWDDRVLSRLSNDRDLDFAQPFFYRRSLVYVPGCIRRVPMTGDITQLVCHQIRHQFQPRDSDVWLVTYPKSGTTWVQNILSHLIYSEPTSSSGLGVGLKRDENIFWLEMLCGATLEEINQYIHIINTTPLNQRRCFKSHSPLGLVEPLVNAQGKIIHVGRNPKDVAVSMWHHSRTKNFGYEGSFEHFVTRLFLPGEVESGCWWEFIIPYIAASNRYQDNIATTSDQNLNNFTQVITLWYEELSQSDICKEIQKIACFIDLDISCERANEIATACGFESMRYLEKEGLHLPKRIVEPEEFQGDNIIPSRNQVRKGGVGGWKKYILSDLLDSFDNTHKTKMEFYKSAEYANDVARLENMLKWE